MDDEEVDMQEVEYAPPAPAVWVGPHRKATGMNVLGFPPGWFGDFHPVPRPQWMTIMTGAIEVGVSDGEKRIFAAGTSALLEDVGSKGHSSREVAGQMSLVMAVIA